MCRGKAMKRFACSSAAPRTSVASSEALHETHSRTPSFSSTSERPVGGKCAFGAIIGFPVTIGVSLYNRIYHGEGAHRLLVWSRRVRARNKLLRDAVNDRIAWSEPEGIPSVCVGARP